VSAWPIILREPREIRAVVPIGIQGGVVQLVDAGDVYVLRDRESDKPYDATSFTGMTVVQCPLWEAKGRRQLIFSSHNANLVVNGDAELVACFNYRSAGDHSAGHIELEGAINVPSMREKSPP